MRAVTKRSGGYPYFIQEYGRVLWNEIDDSPITEAAGLELDDVVQDNLDSKFFAPQFALASETEQRYLLALAAVGDGPYRSAAAATAAGYRDTPGASQFAARQGAAVEPEARIRRFHGAVLRRVSGGFAGGILRRTRTSWALARPAGSVSTDVHHLGSQADFPDDFRRRRDAIAVDQRSGRGG